MANLPTDEEMLLAKATIDDLRQRALWATRELDSIGRELASIRLKMYKLQSIADSNLNKDEK